MKRNAFFKSAVCAVLALVLLLSTVAGLFPAASAEAVTGISCAVKFSKPAICCDAGQTIDLSACAVQFSPETPVVTGVSWTYEGKTVTGFTPAERGVYALTAKHGGKTMTVYVVAKNAADEEYVLYRNDFDTAPTDLRVIEQSNGGTVSVSGGAYNLDGSGHADAYIRVLLPEFLDAFGDATMEVSMKLNGAVDARKWASLMYRVQGGNYPYYQTCVRYDAGVGDGVEISQRNASYVWEVYDNSSFPLWNAGQYNICAVSASATVSTLTVNGYEVASYAATDFACGGFGFQTRGASVSIDYVKITLEGNDPAATACDVSFSKPAIRADMGDTIDLTECDVQFAADTVYTSGKDIVWKRDGAVVTSFTPTAPGVTRLTATGGGVTKNVYVVTRSLSDGEYVLYYNDFTTAPTDFRVVQQTGASTYHDGAGNYVIDASSADGAYGRVLLPAFLDAFGDYRFEARYKDTNPNTQRNWSSLMAHVQSGDYPYMQMCLRYDTSLADGVEFSQRNESNKWSVKTTATYASKAADSYNVYSLEMQGNKVRGHINGDQVISYNQNLYNAGGLGLQAKGLKITVDYVLVTLGNTSARQDTAVTCTVSKTRPAIGCNAGQTVLLSECDVQFVYGFPAVDGSQIVWKKDGKVITQFTATSLGMHTLTATHGDTTMNVYVVAKRALDSEFVLYENDFSTAPMDFRVPQASGGGSCYQQNGTFVLNGSGSANAYVRVLLPSYLDEFGDARLETSIKLTSPVDASKWGSIMFRAQNGDYPYMQACLRYNATVENGVEISQKNASNAWEVYQQTPTGAMNQEAFNTVYVDAYCKSSIVTINGAGTLQHTDTPYFNGGWGFQVRGLSMVIDYVRLIFTNNNGPLSLYTVPGHYADVRDPATGINIAPALVTEVKTSEDFDNILVNSPAVAIFNYDIVDGEARITFADGSVSPDTAMDKLGGKIIPAFRISDNSEADSLASFLIGRDCQDAFAVSATPSVVKRAYQNWKYIRGVVDYSAKTEISPEDLRYEAMANSARVVILPETVSKAHITAIQDSFSCVWLTVSEGKTASVAATNKGPYGIITPDRALTEECYKQFYADNTMIRRTNVIGHRGNPSVAQENTIAGTKTAYANGATAVENDIYLVRDGVLMVMHDKTIDRTTNGSGNTVDFTSAQLKNYVVDYKAGLATEPIPSLEDYFKAVKGNAGQRLVVEIKHTNTAFAQPFAQLINQYDILDQMVVIGFSAENLTAIRSQLPGVPVGLLKRFDFNEAEPEATVRAILEEIQTCNSVCNPGYTAMEKSMIKTFVNRGVTLWPWTVNTQSVFDDLMIKGVGGITTDYSQWSKDFVENLTVTADGAVIATTYGGSNIDVSASAELVVIEDDLGISYSDGVLLVPRMSAGSASYYFRYKSTTPTGIVYYTVTDVMEISGDMGTSVTVSDKLEKADAVIFNTTTPSAVFSPAAQPFTQHQRYLIMSDKYGYIMSYNPIRYTPAGTTGSITFDADGDSENTYYFSGNDVILDHSAREDVMWIMRQFAEGSGGTQLADWQKMVVSGATSFGGQAYYPGIELQKGLLGESGVTYWSSTGASNEYRYLNFRSDTTPFKNDADHAALTDASSRAKYMVESYGDGTYLMYYKASSTDYRFVVCDADGVWSVRRYANGVSGCSPVSQISSDLAELKIRLYEHIRDASVTKRVTFSGYRTYTVDSNATASTVLNAIRDNITVFDPDHKDQHIPYSAAPKVGFYRLVFQTAFDPSVEGTFPVQVIYRAEANNLGVAPNDVVLGTVNVTTHTHDYQTVVTPPTCTEPGSTVYVCACGDSHVVEEVEPTGHHLIWGTCSVCGYVDESYVAPTYALFGYINGANYACEEDDANMGTYWFVDGKLSVVFKEDSYVGVKTVGNSIWYMTDGWLGNEVTSATLYDTAIVTTNADKLYVPAKTHVTFTLTENPDGTLTLSYEPTACNHNYEETARRDATCTDDGEVTYHCTVCEDAKAEVLPALGHSYIWDKCTVCGHVDETYVKPDYYLFGYINGANYACEEDDANMGTYRFEDGKLSAIFMEDSYVAVKTGNNTIWYMTNGWQGEDATSVTLYDTRIVTTNADKLKVPAKLHVIFTLEENPDGTLTLRYAVDPNGHSYEAHVTMPTCTAPGYTTYTCICGNSYVGDHLPATDHSYETITVEPTCQQAGSVTHICDVCGDNYVETLPATGHSYEAMVTAPTCTASGFTTYTCACGHSYVGDEVIANDHSFAGGQCTVCGAADPGAGKTDIPCALVGDMNGWDETVHVMTGDTVLSTTVTLTAGTYQFKLHYGDAAYGNDGIIVNTTETTSADGWLMNTAAGNCTLVTDGGSYRFLFDPQTKLLRVLRLTNETEDDTVPNGTITLKSVTLSLEDEIHYNLYFEIAGMDVGPENMGLIIWDQEPVTPTVNGGGTIISGATYVPSTGRYGISTMGIPARHMGDIKYMVVYAKQNDNSYVYSRVLQYSAKTYCLNRVEKSDNEDMRALCVALMNFGAEAQKYFAATTDYTYTQLMNVGFEDYQHLAADYDADLLDKLNTVDAAKAGAFGTTANGFSKRSVSMSANGTFALNYYFTADRAADSVTFYYWDALRYDSVTQLTPDNASGTTRMLPADTANKYWAEITGIAAKEMDQTFYACGVYEVDGVTYTTGVIPYSLATYCNNKVATGAEIQDLAAAMAVYGYHAKTYFAS